MSQAPLTPGPDAVYADFLARGEFRLQQCESCSRHLFYPRVLCPYCGGTQLPCDATVYACSVVQGKPGTNTDYAVVLVDLQEGPRMMGHIIDCEQNAVRIGMALKARILQKDGKPLVVLAPAGDVGGLQ